MNKIRSKKRLSIESAEGIFSPMSMDGYVTEFMKNLAFAAFDTETTGLFAPSNRLVEIAAVRFRLGVEPSETFQALINPERPMPAEVIRIHGITDEDVSSAEIAKPVLEKFIDFCGDAVLIAHNAPFDISFVGCELQRTGLTIPGNPVLDTIDVYRRYYPGIWSYSLLSLVQHFQISATQAHRALADAEQVRALFCRAAGNLAEVGSFEDLAQLIPVYRLEQWQSDAEELPDTYSDITVAIRDKRALEIVYASAGKAPQKRVIHPTHVVVQGPVYYINAYCDLAQAERTFRLDRILKFRLLDH
jgi:DNA polymerase-3 subunit epsilon